MDDFARQLPDPPPPRPVARSAAIAAALARFDGEPAPSVAATPAPRPPRWQIARGPVGVLASVLLVAVIGIPLALRHPGDPVFAPRSHEVARPAAFDAASPTAPGVGSGAPQSPPPAALPSKPEAQSRARAPLASQDTQVASLASPPASPSPVMLAPPPPPPAPPPPVAMVAAPEPKAAARAAVADRGTGDIVVTAARRSRGEVASVRRGDWNACTIDDPERTLRGCTGSIRTRSKGRAGEAAGHLADGLAHAWQGDAEAAVVAFDAAIALEPKLSLAHLNRGLALWHSGAGDGAAGDFDLAIRYDSSARNYYARARFRRDRGDTRGAEADEARAVEIDSRYADVIEN